MKRLLITILVLMAVTAGAEQRSSITQYGITWTFDQAYETGQYVNGHWWVVGPVTVDSVSPGWDGEGNGSMVNPDPGKVNGFDSRNTNKYVDSLRVRFPLALEADQSLISSVKKMDYSGSWEALQTAAILTCVSSAPAANVFRPQYCSGTKLAFSADDINYAAIPEVATPTVQMPAGADIVRSMERPWIDFDGNWAGTYIHPTDNMPNYGSPISRAVSRAALYCFMDMPERDDIIIRLIQLGIDNYGVIEAGGGWPADGGHASGRKWPILFAGIALNDDGMKGIGTEYGDITFGEDCQTYYDSTSFPRWGIRHCQDPDNPNYNDETSDYRTCCTSGSWVGQMLAGLMMGAKDLWNHNAYFDYVDRWVDEEGAYGDDWRTGPIMEEMWKLYRDNLPVAAISEGSQYRGQNVRNPELLNGMYSIDGKFISKENTTSTGIYLVPTEHGWVKRIAIP